MCYTSAMKKAVLSLSFLICFSSLVFAFGGMAPEPHLLMNLPQDPDMPVMISIEEIKTIPELEGRKVLLKGRFAGWENIDTPPPFSRHDWVLRNDTGAIYVHGPYPEGCSPLDPHTIGREIEITGRIKARLVSGFGNVRRVVFIGRD